MSHEDLTRRALLRTGVAAGAAALVGPAATGGGVAVPNDDYETTTGGDAGPEQCASGQVLVAHD